LSDEIPTPIFRDCRHFFSCSHRETDSPKTRTLAAWKAIQKADQNNDADLPTAKLDDPSTFKPSIKYFRNVAFADSQIDLEAPY
jgi:hypothetical protein